MERFDYSKIERVMRRLEESAATLTADSASPRETILALESFTDASQQLTNVMYKDFPAATGQKWQASRFEGWNAYSDVFKELRKENFHEAPIRFGVRDKRTFDFGDGRQLTSEATLDLSLDALYSDDPCSGLKMIVHKDDQEIDLPVTESHSHYVLKPETDAMRERLTAAGTDRLPVLADECLRVLRGYVEFYEQAVEDGRSD